MTGDEAHRQLYADAIRRAREQGADEFQGWFNDAPSEAEAVRRGYWDFALHILTAELCARVRDPATLTALEIGYGGGRLLNAAAAFFGRAIGVDIHGEQAAVRSLLERLGRSNVELLLGDGGHLPVADGSVDVVYSFIVLQHLPRYESFVGYVREAHRVLRPGGVAQLYYGELHSRDPRARYVELDVPANQISLLVSARHARNVCRDAGFDVVDAGVSYKRVPDGYPSEQGGQAYVTLVRPA